MLFDKFVNNAAPGISADRLNEPFNIRTAVYQSDQIDVTIGRGRASYGDVTVVLAAPTVIEIAAPVINTTYYIWLQLPDGTFAYTTERAAAAGRVLLGSVATGANLSDLTVSDLRSMVADALATQALDDLDTQGQILAGHVADTGAHSATSAATASRIMMRDAQGRAKVVAPAAADDIALKSTVDAVQTNLDTHAGDTAAHSATSAATASRIMMRDAQGRAKVVAPAAADDVALKSNVDAVQTNLTSHIAAGDPHPQYATDTDLSAHAGDTAAHSATSAATPSRIMMRDVNGRAQVAAPSAAADIARKDTVDSAVLPLATKAALEALVNDQYELHMELYYTGHHAGPDIAGLRAMTFDGFTDTARVNGGSTTAVVDTTNRLVSCGTGSPITHTFISAVNGAVAGLTDDSDVSSVANLVDGNDATSGSLTAPAEEDRRAVVILDFGQVRAIGSLTCRMALSGGSGGIEKLAYSTDGSSYTILNKAVGAPISAGYVNLSLGACYSARYWAVQFYAQADMQGKTLYIYEIKGQLTPYQSSVLQSTTKSLDFTPGQIVLYLSTKTPSGTSVTPQVSCDGGTHVENLTLASSRTDPQYGDYTEKKYTFTPAYPGSSLILKVTLAPTGDQGATPEVKRYGLYFA